MKWACHHRNESSFGLESVFVGLTRETSSEIKEAKRERTVSLRSLDSLVKESKSCAVQVPVFLLS